MQSSPTQQMRTTTAFPCLEFILLQERTTSVGGREVNFGSNQLTNATLLHDPQYTVQHPNFTFCSRELIFFNRFMHGFVYFICKYNCHINYFNFLFKKNKILYITGISAFPCTLCCFIYTDIEILITFVIRDLFTIFED